MTRQEKIQEQVTQATALMSTKYGNDAAFNFVVTAIQVSPRRETFGFHCEPKNSVAIGDTVVLADGITIGTVEAII
jgi:hypothetical protein